MIPIGSAAWCDAISPLVRGAYAPGDSYTVAFRLRWAGDRSIDVNVVRGEIDCVSPSNGGPLIVAEPSASVTRQMWIEGDRSAAESALAVGGLRLHGPRDILPLLRHWVAIGESAEARRFCAQDTDWLLADERDGGSLV